MSPKFPRKLGSLHFPVDFEGLALAWMPANSLKRNGSTSWETLVDLVTQIPVEDVRRIQVVRPNLKEVWWVISSFRVSRAESPRVK